MSLSSTMNLEAALFNERLSAWEPLIEPTIDPSQSVPSPWCITCSILPVSDRYEILIRIKNIKSFTFYENIFFLQRSSLQSF